MEVKIEKLAPMHVAYVRNIGPYQECGKAWDELFAWACPNNLCTTDTKYLGVGYDDPEQTPPEKCRYDACITVPKGTPTDGNVKTMSIAGGDYAVFLHKGPYEALPQSWKALAEKWLPSSGRETGCGEANRVWFEQYLNDSTQTNPEALLTAIHLPLK